MKCKSIKRYAALALSLVLSLTALWPATVARASDITIDDSGFLDLNKFIDHATIYIWRRGMPEVRQSSDVGKARDILISWDGKYYLTPDVGFYATMNTYGNMWGDTKKFNVKDLETMTQNNSSGDQIRYRNGFWGYDDDKHFPYGYPHGWYRYVITYSSSVRRTSTLPFNYDALREAGISATFSVTRDLPVAGYLEQIDGDSSYYLGSHFSDTSTAMYLWYGDSNFQSWNEDYTLSADEQRSYLRMCMWRYPVIFENSDGGLRPRDEITESAVKWSVLPGTTENTLRFLCKQTRTTGNIDGWAMNEDYRDLGPMRDGPPSTLALAHSDVFSNLNIGLFQTVGNAYMKNFSNPDEKKESPNWAGSKGDFDVFWCEPTLMDILRTDFTVENGQVSNLDGPIALVDSTVTVKEGGTLTITNWVANQGTIIVEEGGTLYLQDDSCLCRINDGAHTGGGIISNGLIIVGNNAKLCGGGVDGIQLLEGSHVVNYGMVASENFKVVNSHTVENRGDAAVCFYGAGNGVTGSGMGTWYNAAGPDGYMERGGVEPTCNVDLAENAVYIYN